MTARTRRRRAPLRALSRARARRAVLAALFAALFANTPAAAQEGGYAATAASRAPPSPGADRLDAAEAAEQPGALGDPVRALSNLPGLGRAGYDSGQLVVWGSAPGDTRTYVDGVEVARLFHPGGLRSTLHPALVRSVALTPGAFDASFGRGTGGVVEVESVRLLDRGLHGELRIDGVDHSLALYGGEGPVTGLVALRQGHMARLLELTTPELSALTSVPDFVDAAAKLSVQADAQTRVEFAWIGTRDLVARSVTSALRAEPNAQVLEQSDQVGYLQLSRRYTDGARVRLTPFFGYTQSDDHSRFDGVAFVQDAAALRAGLRASYVRSVGAVRLELGVDSAVTRTQLARTGSLILPPREGDVRAFGQRPSDEVSADTWRVIGTNLAPHLSVAIARGALHARLGLRLEVEGWSLDHRAPRVEGVPPTALDRVVLFPEPRLALGYDVTPWLRVQGRAGVHHQPPAPADLSPVFGNPALDAERALVLCAGPELGLPGAVTLRVEGQIKWLDGQAVRSPEPTPRAVSALEPNGEGTYVGASVLVQRQVPEGFGVSASYTLSRATRTGPLGEERLSDFDQTHVASLIPSFRLGGFLSSLRLRYATGAPRSRVVDTYFDSVSDSYQPRFGAHNATRLPDFVQLDVHLEYEWTLRAVQLALLLDVLNATAQRNVEEYAYSADFTARSELPGMPLLATLGLRLEI